MNSQQHEIDIRQWLLALSLRCSPRTTENIEIMVKDYASGLADLPYEAFTPQSREYAARQWEHFPPYKSLRRFLVSWVEKNAPLDTKRLPPIEDPNLSDQDKAQVRSWIDLREERVARGKLSTGLSMLRKWPEAFAHVCRTDFEAGDIARRNGWLDDSQEPLDVSEAGITRNLIKLDGIASESTLGAAFASLGLAIMRKQVEARAPERLFMLPDAIKPPERMSEQLDAVGSIDVAREKVARATAAFEAEHGRKPGALSREQLSALRKTANVPNKPVAAPQPFTEPAEAEQDGPPPEAWDPFPDDAPAVEEPAAVGPSEDAKPIPGLPWFLLENAA